MYHHEQLINVDFIFLFHIVGDIVGDVYVENHEESCEVQITEEAGPSHPPSPLRPKSGPASAKKIQKKKPQKTTEADLMVLRKRKLELECLKLRLEIKKLKKDVDSNVGDTDVDGTDVDDQCD